MLASIENKSWLLYLPLILWIVFLIGDKVVRHFLSIRRRNVSGDDEVLTDEENTSEKPLTENWKFLLFTTVAVIVLPAFVVNLFPRVRHWIIEVPEHVTISRIQNKYKPQLQTLKQLLRKEKEKREKIWRRRKLNGLYETFHLPEILYVQIQSSRDGYWTVYESEEFERLEGGSSYINKEAGPGNSIMNIWHYTYNEKDNKVLVFQGALKNDKQNVRTYSIYFDAEMLNEKLKQQHAFYRFRKQK